MSPQRVSFPVHAAWRTVMRAPVRQWYHSCLSRLRSKRSGNSRQKRLISAVDESPEWDSALANARSRLLILELRAQACTRAFLKACLSVFRLLGSSGTTGIWVVRGALEFAPWFNVQRMQLLQPPSVHPFPELVRLYDACTEISNACSEYGTLRNANTLVLREPLQTFCRNITCSSIYLALTLHLIYLQTVGRQKSIDHVRD